MKPVSPESGQSEHLFVSRSKPEGSANLTSSSRIADQTFTQSNESAQSATERKVYEAMLLISDILSKIDSSQQKEEFVWKLMDGIQQLHLDNINRQQRR